MHLDSINDIGQMLTDGKVILCPTDTIWGLSCNALDRQAVDRIYDIKNRDRDKPLILLVESIAMLKKYISFIHPRIEELLLHHLQPLTVIYQANDQLPKHLLNNDETIAIRVVKHALINELINFTGAPLVSTSANIQGVPSPKNFKEVTDDIKSKVDYICYSERDNNDKKNASVMISGSENGEIRFIRN